MRGSFSLKSSAAFTACIQKFSASEYRPICTSCSAESLYFFPLGNHHLTAKPKLLEAEILSSLLYPFPVAHMSATSSTSRRVSANISVTDAIPFYTDVRFPYSLYATKVTVAVSPCTNAVRVVNCDGFKRLFRIWDYSASILIFEIVDNCLFSTDYFLLVFLSMLGSVVVSKIRRALSTFPVLRAWTISFNSSMIFADSRTAECGSTQLTLHFSSSAPANAGMDLASSDQPGLGLLRKTIEICLEFCVRIALTYLVVEDFPSTSRRSCHCLEDTR